MESSAGTLIREARGRARLSQTDLARRADVAQSVISAYESDKREPGLGTLVKLIEATGHKLVLKLTPAPANQLGLPDTRLGRLLRRHRRAVIEAAARRGVSHVRVFGSVARAADTEASDIDLLVELDDNIGLVSLIGLERELTHLLGVDVDVVPAGSLKPAIRNQVASEAVTL